jgi:tRNA dimethylallyltransferase
MGATEREPKQPLLVLVGPTAAGKSALALSLAPRLDTDLICADSAQVYRHLDIGTAKPTAAERSLVRHHLIDLVEPDRDFSAADYQKAAFKIITGMREKGKLPFMVGGTGLYIKAVTDRFAFGSRGANSSIREKLAAQVQAEGSAALHSRLANLDPGAAAKIHPRDQRRIIRALEVYEQEGTPISNQVERTLSQEPAYNLLLFGLNRPRHLLYRRIEQRVDEMLEQGFLAEVRNLLDMGYHPGCPGLQILGYRQLVRYLQGKESWGEAIASIKQQTRHLAKRQLTWFRRDERIHWLELEEGSGPEAAAEIIYSKVKEILP